MRLFLLSMLSFILLACTSTKSTIKNIDPNAKRPKIVNNAFEITEYATDSNYGYDADYPINIGPLLDKQEEANIKLFFNALEGENGKKITYSKTETCCPFPSKTNNIGAGTLSIYEVTFEENSKKIALYFNIYEKGQILCPKGLKIKKSYQ
ncbi:2-dehydro-3-deoxyphosphooctonate aldolase [Flavobacterium jejuense]|uniref:2-dehydro-3-deoxyphosphooctonate aldolase n=1 Tax=Flavobacterium jejuense TaxID=1544455 RepID=A0ABX0IK24_9FLAO|nr:2-dehydro-3-deoxyphosphooctonate aldolase [Flavobacterium jejuense]NHN24179.1 2-dehydro-3-deoxyphosphooctonate aldolase [Flavobacterium jejuense]